MLALASGDGAGAVAKASKAERLLNRPELTRLLNAQAAELSGNATRALEHYKEMLQDDRTRFVGVQGILKQKLAQGDTDTALKLAERAFALRPKHHGNLDTLFALQSETADWSGARNTLSAKLRAKALPRDDHRPVSVPATAYSVRILESSSTADRSTPMVLESSLSLIANFANILAS